MSVQRVTFCTGIVLAMLLVVIGSCNRSSPETSFADGIAYAEKGAWQKAIDAFSDALSGRPGWVDAYVNRGAARAGLGDYTGAIKDYDEAIRLDPKAGDVLVSRGAARHGLGQYAEAIADYTAAPTLDDLDVDAYHNRAITMRANGNPDAALDDYSAAIQLEPNDVELYRERAALLRERNDEDAAAVDDALAKLTEAVVAASGDAVPRRQRGLVFFEVGEYALALSDLSDAIRLAPEHADTYVARAHAWFVQGHSDKAAEDYTQAIQRGVKAAAEAYVGRGNAYESLGDIAKAVADYEQAVRLNPNDEDTRMLLAWVLATHPAEQYRDAKHAVELAARAVTLTDGRSWRALDVMAAACAEAGNFADAQKYAQQSLGLAPQDQQDAVRTRLSLYRSLKPYREAEQ